MKFALRGRTRALAIGSSVAALVAAGAVAFLGTAHADESSPTAYAGEQDQVHKVTITVTNIGVFVGWANVHEIKDGQDHDLGNLPDISGSTGCHPVCFGGGKEHRTYEFTGDKLTVQGGARLGDGSGKLEINNAASVDGKELCFVLDGYLRNVSFDRRDYQC